ncbi:hypothetical protein ACQP2X_39780 [Actinoplanes sp. CA-131856]
MFALWQPEYFDGRAGVDQWDSLFTDDTAIADFVAEGVFVPINLGIDGGFQFVVKVGQGESLISERESEYIAVSSEPYRFVSHGNGVLSRLELVGTRSDPEVHAIPLASGQYAVIVHLLDWEAEPGSSNEDGSPVPNALPDFIVELHPDRGVSKFRTKVETFDRPEE